MIRIITDSAADMEKEELEKYSITSIPLSVSFGEKNYLDGVDLDKEKFYELLKTEKEFPKTSQPSPEAFLMMRSILSMGTLLARALAMRSLSRELTLGSGPPCLTQSDISLPILVKTLARCASVFSFLCMIFFHLECPDIQKASICKINNNYCTTEVFCAQYEKTAQKGKERRHFPHLCTLPAALPGAGRATNDVRALPAACFWGKSSFPGFL